MITIQLTGFSGTPIIPPQIRHWAIPCVSVLISHLFLHLSISKYLDGRPPLLSISQLTHRKFDSRKSFTNRNWYKINLRTNITPLHTIISKLFDSINIAALSFIDRLSSPQTTCPVHKMSEQGWQLQLLVDIPSYISLFQVVTDFMKDVGVSTYTVVIPARSSCSCTF